MIPADERARLRAFGDAAAGLGRVLDELERVERERDEARAANDPGPHELNLTRDQFRERCQILAGVMHRPCCDAGLIDILSEKINTPETIAGRVFQAQREYGRAQAALDEAVARIFGGWDACRAENWSIEQDSDYDQSIEIRLVGGAKITDEERADLIALGFARVWNDERSARAVSIPLALELRRERDDYRTKYAAIVERCRATPGPELPTADPAPLPSRDALGKIACDGYDDNDRASWFGFNLAVREQWCRAAEAVARELAKSAYCVICGRTLDAPEGHHVVVLTEAQRASVAAIVDAAFSPHSIDHHGCGGCGAGPVNPHAPDCPRAEYAALFARKGEA